MELYREQIAPAYKETPGFRGMCFCMCVRETDVMMVPNFLTTSSALFGIESHVFGLCVREADGSIASEFVPAYKETPGFRGLLLASACALKAGDWALGESMPL